METGPGAKNVRCKSDLGYLAVTAALAIAVPRRLWYRAAFLISGLQVKIIRPFAWAGLYSYRRELRPWAVRKALIRARVLHRCLGSLHRFGRPFPIPVTVRGAELIREAQARGGLVVCSRHMHFDILQPRGLMELGIPCRVVVVASESGIRDGVMPLWGVPEGMPALASNAKTLLKARTVLREGGIVAVLLDTGAGRAANLNILRLVRRLRAEILLATVELEPDGEILVDVFHAPDPFCRTEESIESNVVELTARTERILRTGRGMRVVETPRKANRDRAREQKMPAISSSVTEGVLATEAGSPSAN